MGQGYVENLSKFYHLGTLGDFGCVFTKFSGIITYAHLQVHGREYPPPPRNMGGIKRPCLIGLRIYNRGYLLIHGRGYN